MTYSDFSDSKMRNADDFLSEENDAALPFSERELAERQVVSLSESVYIVEFFLLTDQAREERQARKELAGRAVQASGFHSVAFPLNDEAKTALTELKEGSLNSSRDSTADLLYICIHARSFPLFSRSRQAHMGPTWSGCKVQDD